MDRRDFLAGAALGLPTLARASVTSAATKRNDPLIEKAKMDMLCRQRASWEQGVAMQALMEMGEDALVVRMAADAILRQTKDGRFAIMGSGGNVTDPGSNGPGVIHAYKLTGNEPFKKAADKSYNYYKNVAPKAKNGTLYHLTNSRQIWSDSMFMAPPFIAFMGDYDEAVKQVDGYREYLWNKDKKLFSHMWDEAKGQFKRKAFWGGGNGWSAAALSQIIASLPETQQRNRKKLTGYAIDLLDGCIAHMRDDGLFHDVIDDPNTFVETNLSQMLAYAIYKGLASTWLPKNYLDAAEKMRKGARTKVDRNGVVQDACGSPTFSKPGTSTEAQAFFLMMEAARAKLNT
ncbi:MAG: glycoside hydrolase family 88 protein [Planctomycetota bacterium]|jgi:rhamnogalacturonyl hydrolase YesR